MSSPAQNILDNLSVVARERAARALDESWRARAQAIKAYQQLRFARTYGDLLSSPRYEPAARFFLEELYGPGDFSRRDAQFERIVPALVKLFPNEMLETVAALSALHALSELLDSDMARHVVSGAMTRDDYIAAWQATGRAEDRERQIALTLTVGESLNRYTRRPFLRQSLRMMRTPAGAAGLTELQRFLEAGFDAFGAMRGADQFLATVGARERALAAALYAHPPEASADRSEVLAQLPEPL